MMRVPREPNSQDGLSADIVQGLQSVLTDLEQFVAGWRDRAQEVASRRSLSRGEADELIEAFEKRKVQWEFERESELQELRQMADDLTDAWLRLESEQRSFSLMQGSRQGDPNQRAEGRATPQQSSSDYVGLGEGSEPTPTKRAATASISDTITATYHSEAETRQSREDAVLQFQRLRREIESNRTNVTQP